MSVRIKLILIISTFSIAIVLALLSMTYSAISYDVEKSITNNFKKQQKSLDLVLILVYDRLVESALLISQNPAFKANVSLNDVPSIDQAVEEFADYLKVDLIWVTDSEGKINGTLQEPDRIGLAIDSFYGIESALLGLFPEGEYEKPVLWKIDDYLVQVVSVPIATDNEVIGSLTLGTVISTNEVQDLQLSEDTDFHIIHNGAIIASTAELEGLGQIEQAFQKAMSNATNEKSASLYADGEIYLSYSLMNDSNTYLVSSTARSSAMSILDDILSKILLIALASLGFILFFVYFLGNIITKPISKLTEAFESLRQGKFDTTLEINRKDEFGQLAIAFNEMVGGLKERIKLRSYVGDHTRELVLRDDNEKSRKITACILFSDIRNFTKYSDKKDPQQVIDMLNSWLGFQARLIKEHNGTVDKFIGDELMAIFMEPSCIKDAMACAENIQKEALSIKEKDPVPISLGIGINYGEMVMGDVGIAERKDYTVIGSSVNLASRLCSAAKGGEVLIPLSIVKLANRKIDQNSIQKMEFKGLSTPIDIYCLKVAASKYYH